jgi:hypothetical protein
MNGASSRSQVSAKGYGALAPTGMAAQVGRNPYTKNQSDKRPQEPARTLFTELPVADGIGPVHINRFFTCFEVDSKFTVDAVTAIKIQQFVFTNFSKIFGQPKSKSSLNVATVDISPSDGGRNTRIFNGCKTARFTIDNPVGWVHNDWVKLVYPAHGSGFYAQTLERNFRDDGDARLGSLIAVVESLQVAAATTAAVGVVPAAVVSWALQIGKTGLTVMLQGNKKHFLNGRRSWAVHLTEPLDKKRLFCFETATLEKSSTILNSLADLTDIAGIRRSIIELWGHMLDNFLEAPELKSFGIQPLSFDGPTLTKLMSHKAVYKSLEGIAGIRHPHSIYYLTEEVGSLSEVNASLLANDFLRFHAGLRELLAK